MSAKNKIAVCDMKYMYTKNIKSSLQQITNKIGLKKCKQSWAPEKVSKKCVNGQTPGRLAGKQYTLPYRRMAVGSQPFGEVSGSKMSLNGGQEILFQKFIRGGILFRPLVP